MITFAGISHHTTPLLVREQLAAGVGDVGEFLEHARTSYGAAVLVSTCSRLELYVAGEHPGDEVRAFLADALHADRVRVDRHFECRRGLDAVRHLHAVTCGLESMITGEHEILGQVRNAYSLAVQAGTTDATLSRLFHGALRTGRRARVETGIGRHALSISSVAVLQARAVLESLEGARVLVVGAGEAGRLAAEALVARHASEVVVLNRTHARAEALARGLKGRAAPLEDIEHELAQADVVIACTGADETLVHRDTVERAVAARRRPGRLLIIDIAVPRDFDARIVDLDGVTYRDLDDLQAIAERNASRRGDEVERVTEMVDAATERFAEWCEQQNVAPTIGALGDRAETLRRLEMAKTLRRLNLDDEEREHVEVLFDALTRALTKQLLHDPIRTLRERCDRDAFIDAARTLFRLDEPPRWGGAGEDPVRARSVGVRGDG